MDYVKRYKKMIELRGLTDHTMKSYCTYITAYLDFISDTLHKYPSQVRYSDIIRFIDTLQKERGISDRTINAAISQIRFFTIYDLHKPWDPTQVPMRKFDTYLPFVPSQEEVKIFISSISDIKVKAMVAVMYSSGLRIGEVCRLRYEDISRKNMRIHITHSKSRSDRYAVLSKEALDILTE
jgi:site-specific recombinase XerD